MNLKDEQFIMKMNQVENNDKQDTRLEIDIIANEYYTLIDYYYDLIIRAMTPTDFETVKKTLDIEGTYQEHVEYLLSELKPKEETIDHIIEFLTSYPEFREQQYLAIIKYVNHVIETNPSKLKNEAYKKLVEYANDLKEGNCYEDDFEEDDYQNKFTKHNANDIDDKSMPNKLCDDGENEDNNNDGDGGDGGDGEHHNHIDDEIRIDIGGSDITLKTYQDPLLIHLYSIIFTAFSAKYGINY